MNVLLYTYSNIFSINPMEAKQTPVSVIKEMIMIHGEVKRIESEEIEKMKKK